MKSYSNIITELKHNEVFVFASNAKGFHGAGSAGYATFGEFGNVWRDHDYGDKAYGWKGKWTEKGVVGLQEGTEGTSYGLVTITEGEGEEFDDLHVYDEIVKLYELASHNKDLAFYVAQAAKLGKHGKSPVAMAEIYAAAGTPPPNIIFQERFAALLEVALAQ